MGYVDPPKSDRLSASLVILTKDEIEGLRAIFPRIDRRLFIEVLAFDGGSRDGTLEFYKANGVETHGPIGYGDAFRHAADIAKGDILIFFRPDGNEDPTDFPKLIRKIEEGADHAIASRFLPGARNEEDDDYFKPRRLANRVFTLLANRLFNHTGVEITDTINGFRAVRRRSLREMALSARGFSIEFQMTIRSWGCGHRLTEIPTSEGNRIGGKVKAGSIPVGLEMLRCLFEEWRAAHLCAQKRVPQIP